ncbi:MAG: IS21 family transposase [Armatimonadetes bacterium]|nr:IS21 family transposase [Armatimonadota bacterium]
MERLHMNDIRDVLERGRRGQSDRAIARDLQLSRVTVRKYRQAFADLDEAGAEQRLQQWSAEAGRPTQAASSVAPYQAVVEALLERGVEMRTIYDRLQADHGYGGSYSSVRRFVAKLRPKTPAVTVRVHVGPGEEAQVDFGSAGKFLDPARSTVRTAYVFVMTLSSSRHQYAELVFDQKIPTWLALHRRAFASFGGVPARVVIDNLKAAVLAAALHDPVLSEAYRRFARHYGFLISPNRPRTPAHKGKVESGVHFVKRSYLAGQEFADIEVANRGLAVWVRERAGTRDHGTTRQTPLALFEVERQQLLPLPTTPFELTEVRLATLHRDCHVAIDGSYYSAPYPCVGKRLEVYLFERVVQLYAGLDLLATHARATVKGTWRTNPDHYPPEKAAYLERTPRRCRELAEGIGPATFRVVDTLLAERPLDRLRSVQAILRLSESVGKTRLEAACARALHFGDSRYRRIKDILNAALDQQPLPGAPRRPVQTAFAFARTAEELFGDQARVPSFATVAQRC